MYNIEVTLLQDQAWYNVAYTNKTFFPGISVFAFREPSYFATRFQLDNEVLTETFLVEDVGAGISTTSSIISMMLNDILRSIFVPGLR